MVRLQIFLDQQNFGPGVIDGKSGTYTTKAIEAYNKKFGRAPEDNDQIAREAILKTPTIYATAIVPDIANQFIDVHFKWGNDRHYQATRKDMPYRSIAEFMAERYHTSIDLLKWLNGDDVVDNATTRSALIVPNVEPFHIESMAEGRTYKKDDSLSLRWAVIDTKDHQIRIYEPVDPVQLSDPVTEEQLPIKIELAHSPNKAVVVVEDPDPQQTLTAYDEHRALIVAAFPITPGKPQFIRYGTWKMNNSIEFPTWRFDDSLLKTGKRSSTSLTIPYGPNNPVGVLWMGLSRRGIGIHGTNNPEKIGRGLSAGCIRMANWDVVKMPQLIRPGATVIIK